MTTRTVLGEGYVTLLNVSGPVRRPDHRFDADIVDVAKAARLSFDVTEERPRTADLRLVKYLDTHRHLSPFEMVETWWEMKIPLVVRSQLVRHRTASVNEASRRYVTADPEFFSPTTWRSAAENKKQGSGAPVDAEKATLAADILTAAYADAQGHYAALLAIGIAPEQARLALPEGLFTRWIFHIDLRNLLALLTLRTAEDAQAETREVALAMEELLMQALPGLAGLDCG
jgi:thymidylate synthase (FAD)